MKWLFVLLSLYVLFLSAAPCCGGDACCEDEIELAGNPHEEHDHAELPCSPFFSCNIAHVIVVPDNTFLPAPKQAPVSNTNAAYTEVFVDGYYPPVWQPPRQCSHIA